MAGLPHPTILIDLKNTKEYESLQKRFLSQRLSRRYSSFNLPGKSKDLLAKTVRIWSWANTAGNFLGILRFKPGLPLKHKCLL